jgi:S1-C subfamily serine protease
MRKQIVALIVSSILLATTGAPSAQTPNLREAQDAYERLPLAERYKVAFSLMVTGQFVGIADGRMGPRLFDAVRRFQVENGLIPNGIVTPGLSAFIDSKSRPIVMGWGLRTVTHPTTGASMLAPVGYAPIQMTTQRGIAFEHPNKLMSVDFAFFPSEEVALHVLYQRLGTPGANRQVGYKVLRDRFFVVTGKSGERGFYSRFEATAGGSVGFTLSWQDAALHGDRLSTLMSNSLMTREMAGSSNAVNVSPNPPSVAPLPQTPPQAAVTPPPQQEPKQATIKTGSGFFVSSDGDLLTNSHVVAGCSEALVMDQGLARIIARDNRNDLALLRLTTVNADKKPSAIRFRTGTVQLGEATFVLGYPLAGRLDNGMNFTNGLISALSGIDNDTSQFQMTAPIQPGNSGGPIVDKSGNLIGVVVSTLRQLEPSRPVPQNVNFGIKADTAVTFLRTNNVEPLIAQAGSAIEPTKIAAEGRKQTLQVFCFPN